MKKILLIFLLAFFTKSLLYAQTTETEFLNGLSNSTLSAKDFSFSFNQSAFYDYDSNLTITGKINLNLNFNSPDQNKVILTNKTFSDIKSIRFIIEKSSIIQLENCKFINCGNIYFEFGEKDSLYSELPTQVKITNCEFIDTDVYNNGEHYTYQLFFKRSESLKQKECLISNVKISGCYFEQKDSSSSFLTKSKLLPTRHSILFRRVDNNVSISNISILNNKFDLEIPNYRPFAVVISNNPKAIFRGKNLSLDKFYESNHSINVSTNYFTAVSNDPGPAVFIQGPYDQVKILSNKVLGFGMNFPNSELHLQRDGAIHLYGGRRSTFYSNDLKNVDVSYNTISAHGTGIRLSGSLNATISNNNIKLLKDPEYYDMNSPSVTNIKLKHDQKGISCRTGRSQEVDKQSSYITIEYNSINCNGVNGSIGINLDGTKNFIVRKNRIKNPNNYGILYHANKGFLNQEFGNSIIAKNKIDFDNQTFSELNSNWYNAHYKIPYAGIVVWRDFNNHQPKIDYESLQIINNVIILNSKLDIEPVILHHPINRDNIVIDGYYEILNNQLTR